MRVPGPEGLHIVGEFGVFGAYSFAACNILLHPPIAFSAFVSVSTSANFRTTFYVYYVTDRLLHTIWALTLRTETSQSQWLKSLMPAGAVLIRELRGILLLELQCTSDDVQRVLLLLLLLCSGMALLAGRSDGVVSMAAWVTRKLCVSRFRFCARVRARVCVGVHPRRRLRFLGVFSLGTCFV